MNGEVNEFSNDEVKGCGLAELPALGGTDVQANEFPNNEDKGGESAELPAVGHLSADN